MYWPLCSLDGHTVTNIGHYFYLSVYSVYVTCFKFCNASEAKHHLGIILSVMHPLICYACFVLECCHYVCDVNRFISDLLKLLVCQNEKLGAQMQNHMKELVGQELNPALYPTLFDQIKVCVDKYFDHSRQVWAIHQSISPRLDEHNSCLGLEGD